MRTGSGASSAAVPASAATASSSIATYSSKPTAATWPDCSSPSRLPAPRISRSRIAILKPGAELGVVGQRREAGGRLLGQGRRRRVEEVRVRALARPAHAPADLVELGEPELVGALDDQRVRGRDVEPRLDDRGADEDVRAAAEELEHHLLELLLVHLPVRDRHARRRAHRADALGRLVDRLDAVVEEERLALARELALDRLLGEVLVVLAHVGLAPGGGPRAASRSRRCRAGRRATSAACAGSAWRTATARRPSAAAGAGAPSASRRSAAPRRRSEGRGRSGGRRATAGGGCRSGCRPCPR